MLRITLAQLKSQLPFAEQIHRSFLINPIHLKRIEGNARKRTVHLAGIPEALPLSAKYYDTIKEWHSDSSQ